MTRSRLRIDPADEVSTEEVIYCPTCQADVEHMVFDDGGDVLTAECECCGRVVESERQADWEDIAYERALARAEMWAADRGSWRQ